MYSPGHKHLKANI